MAITQEDVAARAGVSRAAVSLALHNSPRVSRERREAILQAAAELGYRPNAHAAQLASHRSMTIGVVVSEWENPLAAQLLRSVQGSADAAGWGVMISAHSGSEDAERTAVEHFRAHRVDGILMVGTRLESNEVRAVADQLPVVTVNRRIANVDAVSVDDRKGATMAVDHLVELGHTRIAHIDGGATAPGASLRRTAFTKAMARAGLAKSARVVPGDNTEPAGIAAAKLLLAEPSPPTAIFAGNDLCALGVMAAARDLDLPIPGSLSVVGFDDTMLSSLSYVGLTTVSQPADLGRVAVERIIARINDPSIDTKWAVLPPALHVRRTTAPAV